MALRTRDSKIRQTAASTGLTALMGITEPVLYGVNLPKKYPLVAAMIGGGLGGLYAGLTHTHRFATGSSGIPAVLLYLGDDTLTYFINIIIALVITAISAAIIALILSFKYEKAAEPAGTMAPAAVPAQPSFTAEPATVYAPVGGKVIAMEQIPDATFSSGVLGKGLGIEPDSGMIIAPFDGEIIQAADTSHAVGIASADGMELLIHVGIDTVEMDGNGFAMQVAEGDQVRAGQTLLTFDREAIAKAGHPDTVVIMLTTADDFGTVDCAPAGAVTAGTQIIHTAK